MNISFTPSFERSFKKLEKTQPAIESVLQSALALFVQNPFHPTLRTHKLKGKLKHLLSIKITYDVRAVFYFNEKKDVVFVNIGTHDEVY